MNSRDYTQNEYLKRINLVMDYIRIHLDEKPDLETLAGMSAYSPFKV